ncbi:transposable element Tcb1 transposase [Trichonephila clavipes]|nr:transposable element Tcb1 transposase [Trichonephila clavipes]
MLTHLCFDIFELQETKLPIRLINITNERRLVHGHETTPLRVKRDMQVNSSSVETILTQFQRTTIIYTDNLQGLSQKARLSMPSAFDQVSEFDRGRIVAYRDCGISFREISSRIGRNQTTVMRICDHWLQESTKDRRGRSLPRRFQQSGLSAGRSLLGLPLTQSHRRLHSQW